MNISGTMKRILAILFVAVLSVSVLAGCNGAQDVSSNSADTTSKTKFSDYTPAPSAMELRHGYFKTIADIEQGTAGSSLKLARGAAHAFAFAQEYVVGSSDTQELRANLLKAWDQLSEEDRKNFDASFLDVVELLKDVSADNLPAVFEDAGVADLMLQNLAVDNAYQNWETLYSNTLTLGNSEE